MTLKQELYSLESLTLDKAVRSDPNTMGQLLGKDFLEFGASGKKWNRVEVFRALPSVGAVSKRQRQILSAPRKMPS